MVELPISCTRIHILTYPPWTQKLAKRLADHQSAVYNVIVVHCHPAGARYSHTQPDYVHHLIAHFAQPEEEITTSEQSNIADCTVDCQGRGEPIYSAFAISQTQIKLVSGRSASQA